MQNILVTHRIEVYLTATYFPKYKFADHYCVPYMSCHVPGVDVCIKIFTKRFNSISSSTSCSQLCKEGQGHLATYQNHLVVIPYIYGGTILYIRPTANLQHDGMTPCFESCWPGDLHVLFHKWDLKTRLRPRYLLRNNSVFLPWAIKKAPQ